MQPTPNTPQMIILNEGINELSQFTRIIYLAVLGLAAATIGFGLPNALWSFAPFWILAVLAGATLLIMAFALVLISHLHGLIRARALWVEANENLAQKAAKEAQQ